MKKYLFVLLLVSLFIFAPQNVFAQEGYYTLYKRFYKDLNYTDIQHISGYDSKSINIRGGGTGQVLLYPQNFNFTAGTYDHIVGAGRITSDSLGQIYVEDYNVSSSVNASFGFGFKMVLQGNGLASGSTNITQGQVCIIYPTTTTNDTFYFTFDCSVPYNMTNIVQFNFDLVNKCDTILNQTCSTSSNYTFTVGIDPTMNGHFMSDTQTAINNNTNAINNTNSKLDGISADLNNDSTTSAESTGGSYFNNFEINNFGLTRIITAPIGFIQSFTRSCSANPVVLTIFNKDVPLPCGDVIFWNRDDVQAFRVIWNLLVGGPIIYALCLKLYRSVHNALDPDKNESGGLDL